MIIILLVSAITVLPASASVPAASERIRSTLLELTQKSDVIVLAKLDKREEVEISKVGDGYSVARIRTSFDVSSVLKGEPRKFVVLEDDEFRYQIGPMKNGEAPRAAVFIEDIESFDAESVPEPGDTVLIFLKVTGKEIELADSRDGIRKIASADSAVFAERIKELNSILGAPELSAASLAEWLVRCSAEPATRWDGAYTLLRSARRLELGDRRSSSRTANETDAVVAVLTERQRSELIWIAMYRTNLGSGSPRHTEGERVLFELVRRWGGSEHARSMCGQVKTAGLSAADTVFFMTNTAAMLGDAFLTEAARAYSKRVSSVDEAERRSASAENTSPDLETQGALGALRKNFTARCEVLTTPK